MRTIRSLIVTVIVVCGFATPSPAMKSVHKNYPGGSPFYEQVIEDTWPEHLQDEAIDVAWCESSGNHRASNRWGFKGMFQFGDREWRKYGRGGNVFNAWDNSAAAYRYYKVAGWGPWECKP